MTVRQPRYSKEEFARRGDEIYHCDIRSQVEVDNKGKYVAIDIETGTWDMDADPHSASDRLIDRNPDSQIWLVRIGHAYLHHIGPRGVRGSEPGDALFPRESNHVTARQGGEDPVIEIRHINTDEVLLRVEADTLRGADLAGKTLARALLNDADLEGANLAGADLSTALLMRANLTCASLEDANLDGVFLINANLRGADLRGANLRDAQLGGADLRDADLSNAVLIEADLCRANLEEANLDCANLSEAIYDAETRWPIGFDRPTDDMWFAEWVNPAG